MAKRTYRGRSKEEQQAFNKARRAKFQRAKETPPQNVSSEISGQEVPDLSELEAMIEVQKVEIPTLSWGDRFLSKFQKADEDDEKKPVTKSGKEQIEHSGKLISHILPMTLAGLLSLYSQRFFMEPYKACAPSQEEMATLLLPAFRIISRHIGIEGRATQDAIDTMAIILATVTIPTRMLMTAEDIRMKANDATNNSESQRRAASTNSQGTSNRDFLPHQTANATDQRGRVEHDGGNGNGLRRDEPSRNGSSEAERVAELLRRDTEGRRAMGIAPRILSAAS